MDILPHLNPDPDDDAWDDFDPQADDDADWDDLELEIDDEPEPEPGDFWGEADDEDWN